MFNPEVLLKSLIFEFYLKIIITVDDKVYLHGDQPVEDNELDVVVALLHDQVDVAAGSGLHSGRGRRQSDLQNKNKLIRKMSDFFRKIIENSISTTQLIKSIGGKIVFQHVLY